MQNASFLFGFLIRNLSCTRHEFLVFQKTSEISMKGIRKKYAERMTLLSILKGTVLMN